MSFDAGIAHNVNNIGMLWAPSVFERLDVKVRRTVIYVAQRPKKYFPFTSPLRQPDSPLINSENVLLIRGGSTITNRA